LSIDASHETLISPSSIANATGGSGLSGTVGVVYVVVDEDVLPAALVAVTLKT
jgi:hypothetical protein